MPFQETPYSACPVPKDAADAGCSDPSAPSNRARVRKRLRRAACRPLVLHERPGTTNEERSLLPAQLAPKQHQSQGEIRQAIRDHDSSCEERPPLPSAAHHEVIEGVHAQGSRQRQGGRSHPPRFQINEPPTSAPSISRCRRWSSARRRGDGLAIVLTDRSQPLRTSTIRLLRASPCAREGETEERGFPLALPFRARCALQRAAACRAGAHMATAAGTAANGGPLNGCASQADFGCQFSGTRRSIIVCVATAMRRPASSQISAEAVA